MKKIGLILVMAALGMFLLGGSAFALTLGVSNPILIIDGNGDINTDVDILSSITNGLTPGYYLNGDYSSFISFSSPSLLTFAGGDVVDFALYDGSVYYSLSGDAADISYSVTMDFSIPYSVLNAQQPTQTELINVWGISEYFANVTISWDLDMDPSTSPDVQIAFANSGNFDGIAPVPEPGTLLLLGSGLMGVAAYARRRKA